MKNRKVITNESDKRLFFNNLYKIGYSKKTQQDMNRENYFKKITKAFQRRFRQELVDGKIDRECLLISKNILKRYN